MTTKPQQPGSDNGYLRVVVRQWDEDRIVVCQGDEKGAEGVVIIGADNPFLLGDYSYLLPLLTIGAQINVIRPRREGSELLPEAIILEPDFLLDISAIASRFDDYGETPLLSLVKRFAQNRTSRHSLLGDFASQLLDEELRGLHDRPYSESIADFFANHFLAFATCEGLDEGFHADARRQKSNIHRAISEELPKHVSQHFDPEEVVLEPSFVCEQLGLQGRMDFLQTDFRLLIEQKSGRARYVPHDKDFLSPQATTAHYVQLLLYRALLHYGFNIPNEELQPFLLYSKYEHSLLHTDPSPQLLHRALALRNRLVHQELILAGEGFDVLDTISVDDLNPNDLQNRLWTDFKRPEYEALLLPYQDASPTEKAYEKAMLRFVQREYVASKLGTNHKKNSGVCGRWRDSLEAKKEAGNILCDISIRADGEHIVCKNVDINTSNFRQGDIVTLFQYDKKKEPDCRKAIVHRATIEEIDAKSITLRLRMPQTNKLIFKTKKGNSWALEHDFVEQSYSSLYRGVYSLLSASEKKRELFLYNRQPKVNQSLTLNGDFGGFNELQTRVKQAQELFLIIGPPGSGKTSFGMLHTLKEELTEKGSSVAVMAYTNRAVDEVCMKLFEEGIDFVRIGNELSCSPQFRPFMLRNRIAGMRKMSDVRDFIVEQRVVVGTVVAFNSHSPIFSLRSFSLAIVDEASQILEPQIMGLISAKHGIDEAIRKFVFIGDYKQLPAVVQQSVEQAAIADPLLNTLGIVSGRMSLFERLLHQYENDPTVVYTLRQQGRMHEEIAQVSNALFYNGELTIVPLPHQIASSDVPRILFINVDSPKDSPSDTVNTAEAEVIRELVARLDERLSIGIIVPYRNQISAIRHALNKVERIEKRNVTIDTVERFQGSQREVIIYGFTVQQPYQMDFLTENSFVEDGKTIDRKLNVVLTRAMKHLFLVGNRELLSKNEIFNTLIKNYSNK